MKTNFLHNTPFYLQLDVHHVSARFIGHLQSHIDVSTWNCLVVTTVVVLTVIKIIIIKILVVLKIWLEYN